MKIHSYNEWDTLREVVVGTATGANWPSSDSEFAKEQQNTLYKEAPVPSGPVPQWIIDETNEDLEILCDVLRKANVTVHRPRDNDFVASQGMYNYCPRDRLLIAGETVVDTAMLYPCRDQEIQYLDLVTQDSSVLQMPRDQGLICDAANICRMDDKWLFLLSKSGNQEAAMWLADQFPDIDIYGCDFYSGVHIDSTVVPLREGLVMLNASRVEKNNLPPVFDGWDKIWIEDCVARDFYQYPWASKWIGLNCLTIDPSTVIVDALQTEIITKLESKGLTVIPHTLRHSRTLGGGYHCVTLDTWRQHA
jgi:scyllo-inosamine-4-phosphate amidinotransferase 1